MTSIIIPAHNEKENLQLLLEYFEDLAKDNDLEIIIALSCTNSDGTEKRAFQKYVRVLKCEGKSRALQMNIAAAAAQGEVLVFLHADVKPPQTFISDIRQTLDNGYEAGFFSYRFDKENFFLKINASFTGSDGVFTGGGDQCLFIKKEIFQRLGGFNEAQVLMEDFEFFDRMKKHRIPYKIVKNDLLVSARKYEHNSYIRVNLSNFLLLVLFKMGCSSDKLKSIHNRLIRTSNPPNSPSNS